MPSVSVVVPFYNAEHTFARCLRSLFGQSFADLEFVLVDDGSTDGSVHVLDTVLADYPARRPSVRLIRHDTNKGVLQARISGVTEAAGNYIIFADADDTVSCDCYLKMYESALRSDADMVRCGYVEIVGGKPRTGYFPLTAVSDKNQRIREAVALKSDPFLVTKLVRRSLFESHDFVWPVDDIAEDWAISVQLAFLADKVSVVDEPFYQYYIGSSISHVDAADTRYMSRILSEKRNVEAMESLLTRRGLGREYIREFDARKISIKRLMFPLLKNPGQYRAWREAFPEINWRILINRYVPLEYKIKHFCAMTGVYTPLYSLFKNLTGR